MERSDCDLCCPECGRTIRTSARDGCPHCGYTEKKVEDIQNSEYLLITIGKRYWFTSLHFARRGLLDFSSGREIIYELCKADEWQVNIQIVDEKTLGAYKKTHEKI
jgi:hypothetical protein